MATVADLKEFLNRFPDQTAFKVRVEFGEHFRRDFDPDLSQCIPTHKLVFVADISADWEMEREAIKDEVLGEKDSERIEERESLKQRADHLLEHGTMKEIREFLNDLAAEG